MSVLTQEHEPLCLVGTPYVYGSRDMCTGLDCLTTIASAYAMLGMVFPLPDDYGPDFIPDESFEQWAEYFEACDPEPWAIVDMSPSHAGLLMPNLRTILHCRETTGVVLDRRSNLKHLIKGYFRLR